MKRKAGYSLAIALLTVVVVLAGSGFYMLAYSLRPKQNKGKDLTASYDYMHDEYPHIKPWLDSLQENNAIRDTFIVNKEGKRLHALYAAAPEPTCKTALIVHGYTDNAIRMLMIGYLYNKKLKYNILLPDLHNHGLSEGEHIRMGWKDRLDILQWLGIANGIFGQSDSEKNDTLHRTTQMVVHGISMGAATTMMLSGEKLPEYVKCFVEDCGYTCVWDEFSHELKNQFGLPPFPLMYTTSLLCDIIYGWNFREASALEQVRKCDLPMLFIHGEADTYVPTWMVYRLFEAKSGLKELWIAPGSSHAMAYRDHPETYTSWVRNFTDKYIH